MTKFSVRKPFTIFVAVVAIAIFGVMSFTKMVPDLLPNMDFPYVIIVTTAPGAAPEEVESTITKPLEQAMATLNNIKTLSSSSSENFSMLSLEFEQDTNLDSIMVDILQKVQSISDGWDDTVGTPTIMRINPSMLPVMVAAVDAGDMDRYELCQFAQETLIPELESTTGVASITTGGMVQRYLTVSLSEEKMEETNARVEEALLKSLEEARKKLSDAQEEIDRAKNQISAGTAALQNAPQTMLEGIESTESDLSQLAQDAGSTAAQISAAEARQQALEAEMELYTSGIRDMQNTVHSLEGDLAAVQSDRAGLAGALGAADAAGAGNDTPLDDPSLGLSQAEVDALAAQGCGTVGDVRGRDSQLAATEAATGASLEAARVALASAQASAEVRLPTLQAEIDQNAAELTALRMQAQQYADQIAAAQSGLAELPQQLMGGMVQMTLAGGQLAAAQTALQGAQTTLDEANEAYDTQVEAALKAADMRSILTLETLGAMVGAQNFDMPAGYVYEGEKSIIVSVGDGIGSIRELEELPLLDLGIEGLGVIRLSDVADVVATDNEGEIYATLNGNDSLILTFSKQSNYATARVSDNLLKKFGELGEKYPGITFTTLVDQGDYIYLIRDSIVSSILWGALFSVIILFIFLRDWRPTVITLFSIPVSLLFALTLMYFTGVSVNIMSLSGLAISVGMLVDNSIVVIENTYRLRNLGEPDTRAAVSGAAQMGGAIAASTLTTICVFVPIAFVDGLTREIFTDMILTLSYTLIASLLVALTLVPALTGKLLRAEKQQKEGWLSRMMPKYRAAVLWGVGHKAVVLLSAVALLFGSFAAILSRGFTFMPEMEMKQMNVDVTMPEGSSFEETVLAAGQVAERIMAVEGVDSVGGRAGDGGTSILSSGNADVTFYVLLEDDTHRKASAVAADINAACEDLDCTVFADSNSLMSMFLSMMTGDGITVRLYGNDLNDLQAAGNAVAGALREVEGVTTVTAGDSEPAQELHFTVDKEKAVQNGLTVAQIYMEVAKSLANSADIMELTDEGNRYTVTVETRGKDQLTREYLEELTFTVTDKTGEEKEVALRDVAEVGEYTTPSTITRLEQRRYLDVKAGVDENYNITKVTDAAEKALESVELPEGVEMSFSGEREAIMDAMKDMLMLMLVGVVLVYLVMVAQFQNLKSPFIVMFTIPLAFTGGFLGLLLCGMELNVLSMLGLIMLVGIIVNNGIVLVDYINQLRIGGMARVDAIAEAAVTRLRPILMTSITTILGLIVMALGQNEATSLVQPLAVTCIGGLVYATLMTLFVVPVMYDILSRKELYAVDEEDLVISTR